jgi:hypothetical protein
MICIADLHESQDPTFQRKKAEFRRTAENSHPWDCYVTYM